MRIPPLPCGVEGDNTDSPKPPRDSAHLTPMLGSIAHIYASLTPRASHLSILQDAAHTVGGTLPRQVPTERFTGWSVARYRPAESLIAQLIPIQVARRTRSNHRLGPLPYARSEEYREVAAVTQKNSDGT